MLRPLAHLALGDKKAKLQDNILWTNLTKIWSLWGGKVFFFFSPPGCLSSKYWINFLGITLEKPHSNSINNILLILIEKLKTLKHSNFVQTQKNMLESEMLQCA